jgi:FtsP/CotA-like multicopper oxidase with cupredoxin domain
MLLDTAEEWKIMNLTSSGGVGNIAHPFHIHVNPFQIFEVFNPNGADAKKGGKCYADPTNPDTWKPCPGASPKNDFIWWDVFAIPPGRQDTLSCTSKDQCPEPVRDQVHCPGNGQSCTIVIPGYFKMRSRFADFTGQYVLHCHILAHEDRGMMQLVEVVPNTTIYGHH